MNRPRPDARLEDEPNAWLTVAELTRYVPLTREKIWKLIADGVLPATRLTSRTFVVAKADALAFVESSRVRPKKVGVANGPAAER
jgi:excisionase family DNA binding protein